MYDECYAYSCVYIIRLRYLSALAVTNSASVANWSKSRHRGASGRLLWTMYKTVSNKLRAPTPLYVTHHAHDTPERGHRPSLAL